MSRFGTFYFDDDDERNRLISSFQKCTYYREPQIAEGFDNVKNLEDVAFLVAESKLCILLRLEGNFHQTKGIRPKTLQIVLKQSAAKKEEN